jgi:hypothetical protein
LQVLDGFQNEDALLAPHFRNKAKTLKEAQAGEHKREDALKFYTEREWPKCDVIMSNPPFLGDKLMRGELGDDYVEELRKIYSNRIPGQSDLCCYWFEKARDLIEHGKCKRAGLLATQGIRGGANREVLKRIKETGDIFFAESDREWILSGANVHVSMVGFDGGEESHRLLNKKRVPSISATLGSISDLTQAAPLAGNAGVGFIGTSMHGPFDFDEEHAKAFLEAGGNPNGKPNSDVVRPILNAFEITKKSARRWVVAFEADALWKDAAFYQAPAEFVRKHVKPIRDDNHRKAYRDRWWIHGEARPAMNISIKDLPRFPATPRVSKHRIVVWVTPEYLPSDATVAFARSDDYFFGVIQSRFHSVWALFQGTRLETRPRYTPTTCFETFPFPFTTDLRPPAPPPVQPPPRHKKPEPDRTYAENLAAKNYYMGKEEPPPYGGSWKTPADHHAAIADAARELNEWRENWLNPPEWTVETILEFPGSADGPWARYVVSADNNGIGTVHYPRLEPRDADCAAKLKDRTLTKLYNERPAWLDLAHKKLDAAVAAAYGWPAELTEEQILERLLALNLERAAEETKASKATKPKISRQKHGDELI